MKEKREFLYSIALFYKDWSLLISVSESLELRSLNSKTGISVKQKYNSTDEVEQKISELLEGKTLEYRSTSFSYNHYDNLKDKRCDFKVLWGIDNKPDDVVKLLNGSTTYFRRTVGYCAYHKCYLTENQMSSKACLSRNCQRLIKIESPFWIKRDEKVAIKKLRKLKEI